MNSYQNMLLTTRGFWGKFVVPVIEPIERLVTDSYPFMISVPDHSWSHTPLNLALYGLLHKEQDHVSLINKYIYMYLNFRLCALFSRRLRTKWIQPNGSKNEVFNNFFGFVEKKLPIIAHDFVDQTGCLLHSNVFKQHNHSAHILQIVINLFVTFILSAIFSERAHIILNWDTCTCICLSGKHGFVHCVECHTGLPWT